jgi:hypothetical protein
VFYSAVRALQSARANINNSSLITQPKKKENERRRKKNGEQEIERKEELKEGGKRNKGEWHREKYERKGRQNIRRNGEIKNFFNALKDEFHLNYTSIYNSIPTSQKAHSFCVTEPNQLILNAEIVVIYSKNYKKSINTVYGQNS